jgi:hypothetical protein
MDVRKEFSSELQNTRISVEQEGVGWGVGNNYYETVKSRLININTI